MLVPWGTDAPIYHWPVATGGLIVANIGLYVGEVSGAVDPEVWSLALGHGLHPMQWISHAFLHAGVMHLVGNLIFLWVFGLIVEGKIGALPFLAIYVLMCLLDGVVTQTLMLHKQPPGYLLGASGAIFGLMAIAMVWAPKNEVFCHVFGFGFRVWTWDAPVYLLAMLYLGLEALEVGLGGLLGDALMKALVHLPGALWGFLIGSLMVKVGWVDCEGWDMYSLLDRWRKFGRDWKKRGERLARKKKSKPKARHVKSGKAPSEKDLHERAAAATEKLRERLSDSDFDGARAAFEKYARTLPSWPSEGLLLDIIKTLHGRKEMAASVPYMQAYCDRFPDRAARVRLKLAQVLIRDRQRPAHALRVLEAVPESALPDELRPVRRQLETLALHMQEEGVLELEEDYG